MCESNQHNSGDGQKQKLVEQSIETFRHAWDAYLKFYTVFLTFNLTATGLVFEFVKDPNSRRWIATAFALQNVFALITGLGMCKFSNDQHVRLKRLLAKDIDPDNLIPRGLSMWGAVANVLGHIVAIVIWVYIFVFAVSMP